MQPKTRRKHYQLRVETLEALTLLSGVVPLQTGATAQVASTVPGTGLETVFTQPPGTSVAATDVTFMQRDASANNLEIFLSQTELLLGSNASAEQYAAMLVGDHRDSGFALQDIATMKRVILPPGVQGTDVQTALGVLAAANGQNFDRAYLTAMVQSHTQLVDSVQTQQIPGAQDPQFKAFLQATLPTDQAHLTLATDLLNALTNGTTPPTVPTPTPSPTGTSTLASGDAQFLQQAYSDSTLDKYLSQLTALVDGQYQAAGTGSQTNTLNNSITQYAQKLVADHTMSNYLLEGQAFATNTPLTAGIDPSAYGKAQQILRTLNASGGSNSGSGVTVGSSGYERAYLTQMVQSHQQDISSNTQALGTLQDPNLVAYARTDIPTNSLHLTGAQSLLTSVNQGTGTGTGTGLNINSPAAVYVYGLYRSVLNRTPSQSEINAWVARIHHGASTRAIYNAFVNSSEHRNSTNGGSATNNKAYVDSLYANILGRQADASGEAFWVNLLNRGRLTQYQLLQVFYNSSEYRSTHGTSNGNGNA